MLERFPSEAGRVPVTELNVIDQDSKVLRSPMKSKIGPLRPGLVSIQCSRIEDIPLMYERSPERKESER
jgi:hypothetical protein